MKSILTPVLVLTMSTSAWAEEDILEALRPTTGGLTTQRVVERSVRSAPAVHKAQAQVRKASSKATNALLGFGPRVDLSANYTRLSSVELEDFVFPSLIPGGDPIVIEGGDMFPQFLNTYDLRARISIPVSAYFLSTIHTYHSTLLAEEGYRYQLRAQQGTMALQAIETFYNTIRARAARIVARNSVNVLTEHAADLEQLALAGLATEGDFLQVKAQLSAAKVALERADGSERVARAKLRRTLHERDVKLEHAEELFDVLTSTTPKLEESLAEAMANRAEIQAMNKAVEARESLVSMSFGNKFPKLSLDGTANYSNPNQRAFPSSDEFSGTWQVGVSLSWSPNDYVNAMSAQDEAEEDLIMAKADLVAMEDGIVIEVSNAVAFWQSSFESITAAQEGLTAAQGSYDDRKNLLAAGDVTTRDLLKSEADLRRAQLQLVNAHLDLRTAQARLDRALGRYAPEIEAEGTQK